MGVQKPRIIFLDAGTVDFGDISFKELEALGDFKAYHATLPSKIVQRAAGAQILIVNKCVLTRQTFESLPDLKAILVAATGVNNVDFEAARRRSVAVMNVTGYSTESVVQHTIGLILGLACRLIEHHKAATHGEWSRSPFFTLGRYRVTEVAGKILGILGHGAIGSRVAEIARALGMRVILGKIPGRAYSREDAKKRVSFETLIKTADFLSIHAPLSPLTKNLIGAGVIRKMKPGSFIINVSRGGIVSEYALRSALQSGHLGGAALDVLTEEPPPERHPLFGVPRLILTPHVAWASRETRVRLIGELAQNLQAFLIGRKRNRIV